MVFNSSKRAAATAVVELEPGFLRYVTCPMCRTTDPSLTEHALTAGGNWRCVRCGQHWDAPRLAAVGAYEAWALEHEDSRLQARHAGSPSGLNAVARH